MSAKNPSKASILEALSQALDLVEGQPPGHAQRTSRIALQVGRSIGLMPEELEDLYYAALLKDSGCSNNSVRVQKIFGGDEQVLKQAVKLIDWTSQGENLKFAWRNTERGRSVLTRLRRMLSNVEPPAQLMDKVTKMRCTRGASISRMLGFRPAVADAILYLDEHWDGRGSPYHIAGDALPILSRILCFAQTFEVFKSAFGVAEALDMARARSGAWFDPEVVRVALGEFGGPGQVGIESEVTHEAFAQAAIESDIDAICEAFAMIIDAKSSFTSEHSIRVTKYAVLVAECFGIRGQRLADLRRGALLHDIGKLGVPTGILEKPGKLDAEEFDRIKLHPKFGHEILSRIPSFEPLAEIASSHHERLDGRGYWQGKGGDDLSLEVRIVSVSDVFDALTAERPYRAALPLPDVWVIMDRDAGAAFDPACLDALKSCVEGTKEALAA